MAELQVLYGQLELKYFCADQKTPESILLNNEPIAWHMKESYIVFDEILHIAKDQKLEIRFKG